MTQVRVLGSTQVSPGDQESLKLAQKALAESPNYVLSGHQKKQLWGLKLRQATAELFKNPNLQNAVERAEANADPNSAN